MVLVYLIFYFSFVTNNIFILVIEQIEPFNLIVSHLFTFSFFLYSILLYFFSLFRTNINIRFLVKYRALKTGFKHIIVHLYILFLKAKLFYNKGRSVRPYVRVRHVRIIISISNFAR